MADYLDRLTADMKAAMKAGDKSRLEVLRMVISEIKKKAEESGELDAEAEAAVLHRAVKTRADTVVQATAAGRNGGNEPENADQCCIPAEIVGKST